MAGARVLGKGWIRDAVLASISKNPSTLTALSKELEVTKSTVDYHLRGLLERGLIEISGTSVVRGGVVSKVYSLGKGAMILLPTLAKEKNELHNIEEAFQVQTLAWDPRGDAVNGLEIKLLLYRLFLHMFSVTRSQHQSLLTAYGKRAGAIVASHLKTHGRRGTLLGLTTWMRRSDVASADVVDVAGSRHSVLILSDCLGSAEHPSRACWFLEGMVEGIVQARLGSSCAVSRLERPGIQSCCLVVGKGSGLDGSFLKEAILSSPMSTGGGTYNAGVR